MTQFEHFYADITLWAIWIYKPHTRSILETVSERHNPTISQIKYMVNIYGYLTSIGKTFGSSQCCYQYDNDVTLKKKTRYTKQILKHNSLFKLPIKVVFTLLLL